MPEEIRYKEFVLDQFQIDAIRSIEQGRSVIVSAATGTGKTLIADYLIDKLLKEGKKIIYTAPIKALSNQKYKDFKKEYGEGNVGILTGDVSINRTAPVLIMTTEIFRNMLITKDEEIHDINYVVFDEIHFINDIERGTVWEESIIFAPQHMKFLCLSATIPNAREFADWIESLREEKVDVISYGKRAVPLKHYLYDRAYGLIESKELKKKMDSGEIRDYYRVTRKRRRRHQQQFAKPPSHLDLVYSLRRNNWLPCIFFVFNRLKTQQLAEELSRKQDFSTQREKQEIHHVFNARMQSHSNLRSLASTVLLKEVLMKGIAFHHAGLLPIQKDIVEELFGYGLIKVLYATETFSVGVNYPAKAVAFFSLEKYDGITHRPLNTKEYFQLAGRAGRRGIDTEGFVVALYNPNTLPIEKVITMSDKDIEPIRSQFKLSYNSVLNLKRFYDEQMIETVLKSNFDYYLRKKQNRQIKIMASYNHKVKNLMKFGYLDADTKVTDKGIFATHIYSSELLVAELFATGLWKELDDTCLSILIAAITYEPRRMESFSIKNADARLEKIWRVVMKNDIIRELLNKKYVEENEHSFGRMKIRRLVNIVSCWVDGGEFKDLLKLTNLLEGDIIRLFRQTVDMMEQIKRAALDHDLEEKMEQCKQRIYRDVVKPEF